MTRLGRMKNTANMRRGRGVTSRALIFIFQEVHPCECGGVGLVWHENRHSSCLDTSNVGFRLKFSCGKNHHGIIRKADAVGSTGRRNHNMLNGRS